MMSLQRGGRGRRWRRPWCLRPRRRGPRWPRRPGSRVWRRGVTRGKTVGAATLTSLRQDGSRPEWPVPKRIIYYTDCFDREWATTTLAATANVAAGTLTAATPTITRHATAARLP